MQFVDIHGHYAWDIDDGVRSKQEAAEALSIARDNGIVGIIATPHVIPGTHTVKDIQLFKRRLYELRVLAQKYHIGVFEGCELFLNHDYLDALRENVFIPVEDTHYLMVEFDVRKQIGEPYEVEEYLYEITMRGYKPIIAHAERYFRDGMDLERVQGWIDSGYVIQMNTSSLLGIHGKTVKNNAYQLLENGLVHAIATDMHRSAGHRIPNTRTVYSQLSKKYDYQTLKKLLYQNPIHILKDEEVEPITIKRSLLSKLFNGR